VSAIFGLTYFDGADVDRDLQSMDRALAHRGPDAASQWIDGSVGMGHRTLWTTPESVRERQPVVDPDGAFVVTGDVRIDNRTELASELDLDLHAADGGDATLVLAAYKKWGERAPERLIGDFAFAIWDSRNRTMFCARDPMGVRPLYYAHRPRELFALASHVDGVLACQRVPRTVNQARVAEHLLRRTDDRAATFYETVVRLPAAHSMTVRPDAVLLRRYWSLDRIRELHLGSNDEYEEAFRECFLEAVRCRTRSAFPVGSTLSGGLDSSSIACAAGRVITDDLKPVRTFSAIFPSLPANELRRSDERPYVQAALAHSSFDHTWIRADEASPLLDGPRMMRHLGGASLAANLYIHWEMYRRASAKGVRVFLDGIDGDTTVSHGFEYLTELASAGRLLKFLHEARAVGTRNRVGLKRIAWEFGIGPFVPDILARLSHAWRRRAARALDRRSLLSAELRRRAAEAGLLRAALPSRNSLSARASHVRGLNSPLIPYALELADAATGAFAIEARYPYFDRRLVELCVSLPPRLKLRDGWNRATMRCALGGVLPPEIQWRVDKADLSPNFTRTLFSRDRNLISDVIHSESGLERYLRLDALRTVYGEWKADPLRRVEHARVLFAVTTLGLWLNDFGSPAPTKVSRAED
jgi:asparagine synthase (glutamine-hydrolysing)